VARYTDLTEDDLPRARAGRRGDLAHEPSARCPPEEGGLRPARLPLVLAGRPGPGQAVADGVRAGWRCLPEVACVAGDKARTAAQPFPVRVVPADLVRRLHP
jgi:hypothetical protein